MRYIDYASKAILNEWIAISAAVNEIIFFPVQRLVSVGRIRETKYGK